MTPFTVKESQQWTDSNETHSYTLSTSTCLPVYTYETPINTHNLCQNPAPSGTFVVINITTLLTHYYHPKSINTYIKVHTWYCTFSGFGQCIIICILHWTTTQNSFTALKILCALLIYPSLPQSLETTVTFCLFFTDYIVLPLLECHRVGTPQFAVLSYWLLSFSCCCSVTLLLLLLSRFSRVQLCVTP